MSAFRKQPNELSFTQLSQNQANSRASASHRSSAQPFISSKLLQPPESYTTEAKLAAVYNHLEQLRTTYNGSDTFLAIGLLRSDGAEAPVEHPEPAAPIGDNPSIAATTKYKVAYQAHITEADRRVLHKRNLCTVIKGSVSPALLVQIEAKHPGADDTLSTNPAALISCIRAMFVGRDLTREQASTNLADAQSRFMRSTYSGLVHSSIHLKFYKSTVGEADSILRSFGLGYNGILITQAMHNIISTLDLNEHVLENFYSNTMLLLGKHVTNNAEIAALEIKRSQKQQEIVQANGDHKKALIQEKQELTRSVTDKKESINKLPSTVEEFFESLETHIAMSRLRLRTSSRTQTALIASTEVSTLELNEPHDEHEDEVFFSNAEGPSQSSSQASQSPGQRVCVACGSSKHIVANCRHSQFCTHCDIPGHNYTSCRKRDEEPKKRKDTGLWCDRCDINTHNIDTCSRRKKLNVDFDEDYVLSASLERLLENHTQGVLVLDSAASIHISSNPELISNPSTVNLRINGLSGVQAVTIRGENGFLGVIHLCPQLRINHGHLTILSYIDLAKKGLICIESTTIFHLLDRPSGKSIVVFTARGDSKILSSTGNPAFFNLLRESPESVYMARSAHDFEKMRQCSMLLKRCYYPGQEASRHLVRSISGLPFDASAVQPAFEYDPDRTTFTQQSRRLANHENNSTPSIEMSDGSVDLAIDIMYCSWGDRDVLVMVTTPYNYLFTAPIKNLTAVVIHASLTLVVDALASASKKIRLAITDSAPNLKAACSLLRSSHQVLSEHRTASSHNPKADISIRYLKEKLRMAQLLLPIEITTPVYDAILSGITMTTNLIPCQQNGWISSHSALFGRNETIPLKGCWAATIGDSVYVAPTTDKHSNSTTDSRSMEGIYLGFSKIHQHVVVTANGLISRNNVTTSQTPFHTLIKNLNDNALGRRSTSPQTDTLISSNTNESHSIMAPPPASDISVRDSVEPSEGDIRTDYLDEKVQSELSSLHSSAAPADQVLIAANIQDLADEDFNWRAWSASVGLCAIDDPDGIAFAAVDTSNITSLSAALRIHAGDPTMLGVISSSCESELRGLMDAGTFTPIHMSKLSRLQVTHMLRSSVKFKMKNVNSTSPTGKARFVADPGGQPQDLYSREETSSSAVGASTVLSLFVLAASSDFFVRTFDIKQAYLHGVLGDPVPMSIKSNVADIICKIDGKYNAYRRPDKSLIVMVRRGLYGQRASGKIWWDLLAQAILSFGFSQNAKDEYLFYKLDPKGDIASCVAIYVDDLFVMSRLESSLDQLEQQLIGRFKEITSSGRSDKLKYLGMDVTFDRTNKTCSVIMSDLVTKILAFRPPLDSGRAPTSPAQDDLYSIDELGAKLSSTGSENFHSSVAQLLYLAKRTRYDLLCAVQFLTSRVNAPSVQDAAKLDRIISYLAGTKSMELTLGGDKQNRVKLNGYFDASFKSRAGGLSQSGSIITYGRGSVYASSKKQSIVCLSAAEAELYALSEGAHELLHLQQVLEGLNLNSIARPADVQQDNESVIASIRNGRACSTKSKHIEQRHYWVSSYCTNQKFDIHHCRTELMVADILTKPLQGAQFRFLRGLLLGHAAINE